MQIKKTLEFGVLKEHFHLPMVDVAKKFGICTTVFKRMCRSHGIKRWPFRKLQSIERRMFVLNEIFLPLNAQAVKELKQLTAARERIINTGIPGGQDDDGGAPARAMAQVAIPPSRASVPAPSPESEQLSHVTVSLTDGAVSDERAISKCVQAWLTTLPVEQPSVTVSETVTSGAVEAAEEAFLELMSANEHSEPTRPY
eukprot:TRINITY_DN2672_c0_g1_i6.p1 TRINITY_DN2672_c0_g1~~TRINITY_DN2672_c0_g1_i6.p1  ORF type:complete len:199 (-),score=42.58 TRINITY_DN2672_c0_g1_i6:92-688(-)